MKSDVTFLGLVRRVIGAKVYVEISSDIPSANPIIDGRVHRLGQVGSYVRIPLGFMNLYGVVSTIGASEVTNNDGTVVPFIHGQRWMEVQLVGESFGTEGFQRGVSIYPTLDDEAHIVTERDLSVIYGTSGPSMISIGTHAASDSLSATVDLNKIVTRHAAVLGSTGSGKSNTIAGFLNALSTSSFPNAQLIVVDPHGEYGAALKDKARVFSISDPASPLTVPYWALSFEELAWFLVNRTSASETIQDTALRDYILEEKRQNCEKLRAGKILPDEITVDSPMPFSIRGLWYHFDRRERITYEDIERTQEALEKEGNHQTLTPARFRPHGMGNTPPFRPQTSLGMGSYLNKILGRLKDKKFDFLLNPTEYDGFNKDLHDLVLDWIDHEHSITVLDLGGIPFEVIDVIVGVVTRILFEDMFWGRDLPGIGRQRPLLIVYEEAHAYLPRGGTARFVPGYAGYAVRRVFKEGRKYGVGAILVSQRPSELDETILSQCGTFFSLRLSNPEDQGRIKATVPDALGGLMDLLPALRTGEAIVLGEAIQIPSRIRLPLIEPRPKSDDPEPAKRWQEQRVENPPHAKAITAWRRQRMAAQLEDGQNGENSS